jgi:hypothetical protein
MRIKKDPPSKRFEREVKKLQCQGVIYSERGEKDRDSCIYLLRVNMKGMFAVSRYRYWSGTIHGRYPIEEWEYDSADEALARFEEIKALPYTRWSSYCNLKYAD